MASKINSRVSLILKVLIAVAIIVVMVRSGHLNLSRLWDLMTLQNVAVTLLLIGLCTLGAAWRWIVLIRARGFKVSFTYGFSLYLIGMFFNYALPGAVSGDLVRGYYLVHDHPGRKVDGILSILIDRILGVYSFFIFTLIATLSDFAFVSGHEQIRWIASICALIFLGMTLFFLISFSERLYARTGLRWLASKVGLIKKVMEGFQRFGRDRRTIGLSVFVSLISQLLSLTFFYYLAYVMGETDITWKVILFVVPMGFLITALPIAPAGVGVGQVAFVYLFSAYLGRTSEFAALSITAFQMAMAIWALVGAVVYIRRRKPHEFEKIQSDLEVNSV